MKPNLFPVRGYKRKIIRLFGQSSIVGYWPLNERLGATAFDVSGRGFHGAHTGIAPDQPGPGWGIATLYDGANDFTNVYSDALVAAFNGAEGTLAIWAKVSGAGVWTDGLASRLVSLQADANNMVQIRRGVANNRIQFLYNSGGTNRSVDDDTSFGANLLFFHCAITWSQSGNFFRAFANGVQSGVDQTVGIWAGSIGATTSVIGALNTSASVPFSGNLAHAVLLNRAATAAEMAEAARVN